MRILVTMTQEFKKKLEKESASRGMGQSEFIRYAINQFLDRERSMK